MVQLCYLWSLGYENRYNYSDITITSDTLILSCWHSELLQCISNYAKYLNFSTWTMQPGLQFRRRPYPDVICFDKTL